MAPKKKYPDSYDQHAILDLPLKSELEPLKKKARKYLHRLEESGHSVDDLIEMLDLVDVSI